MLILLHIPLCGLVKDRHKEKKARKQPEKMNQQNVGPTAVPGSAGQPVAVVATVQQPPVSDRHRPTRGHSTGMSFPLCAVPVSL